MTDELKLVVVPKELYYHEVAYVRGLEARAEAAEKERDDFRPAGEMLLAMKARAEAAEERAHYAEGVADTNINRANEAEEREAVLRAALEEIEALAFVKLIDAYSIARAALEATP